MANQLIQDFRDLVVWQRSMDLVLDVYRLTDAYPRHEMFNLTTHTRKSAISIPSNVAEGANRRSLPPYINHVNIALGSEGELFTQLLIGQRLGYISQQDLEKPFRHLAENRSDAEWSLDLIGASARAPESTTSVASGRWPVAGGRWPVAGGRWPVAGGRWPVAGSQ